MTDGDKGSSASSNDNLTRELNKKRGVIKGRLTLFVKFVNSLRDNVNEKQLAELRLRYDTTKALFSEFNTVQSLLEENAANDNDLAQQLEIREAFENMYYNIINTSNELLSVYNPPSSSESKTSVKIKTDSLIKLPKIALPSFDGSYDNWLEFRDTYLSMIHNSDQLDDIQRFHYLRSALTGTAIHVIKSLEFSASNYTIAWDLLNARYNNKKLLIHNHVKALFSMQALSKESPALIRKLIDTVLKNLRALKSLGEPTEHWDTLIMYLITSKLDINIEKEWEQHKNSSNNLNHVFKLDSLLTFLREKANVLEMINANHSTSSNKPSLEINKKTNVNKVHSLVSAQNTKKSKRNRVCIMCNENHSLYSCNEFLNLTPKQKLAYVESKSLCNNCLRQGHSSAECYFGPCRRCNQKHNSLLHEELCKDSTTALPVQTIQQANLPDSTTKISTALHSVTDANNRMNSKINIHTQSLPTVLLSTALVEVAGKDNKYIQARALLDGGSQHCFITNSLKNKLNAQTIQSTFQITGVGHSVTQSTMSCEIKMRSLNGNFCTRINCIVLPQLTSALPSTGIDSFNLPSNISLADTSFCTPSQIDLLIGADYFWDLLLDGRMRLTNGPYLQNTKLGWIISGPIYTENEKSNFKNIHCNFVQTLELNEQLKKFWEIEELPQTNTYYSEDERACEKLFLETCKRDENGRFSVRIPLRESPTVLGDSFQIATKQFLSLERRLQRAPEQYSKMYSDFMQEYLSLGHMTRIENYLEPVYFLPHHGVFREQSTTTKLRVVFNASQKTDSGISLNEIQYSGPALQNDLFAILLRFRQYAYVACADIEKMFRQIFIQEDQRNLQLILWRDNKSDPIGVYQLNTVTYGTASAPYLSMRCVRQLGYECQNENISRVILNDFYVDDLITGSDSVSELAFICKEVMNVCLSGCFSLRKWIFNSNEVANEVISSDLNEQSKYLSLGENVSSKTLGLGWLNYSDEFHFITKLNTDTTNFTKRFILSVVSQIYDPLGLLSPIIIVAKILLQKLWLHKIEWDDLLPQDITVQWNKFVNSLTNLPHIRVPRHVTDCDVTQVELHIFTDASESAYGACAYIRSVNRHGDVTVRLLCSKSRVSPLKPVSIPRLELCGALLGAKLQNKILNSLRLQFNNVVFWTDSTIVLSWLRMSPNLLKTFVQNRVVEINDLTENAIWLHVDGKNNPADLVSRGTTLDELNVCSLWWNGPKFLHEKVNKWSETQKDFKCEQNNLPELKRNTVSMVCSDESKDIFDFNRFSSLSRLIRAFAFVFRFVYNARLHDKSKRIKGPLTTNELNKSWTFLVNIVQKQSFLKEYNLLLNQRPVKTDRNLLNLNLFLDKDGIIRVGGRLSNSLDFTYDKKYPMLLCSKHHFTQVLFIHEHIKLLHAGPQLLLSHTRNKWWTVGGRNLARKTVRQCIKCSRIACKPIQQIMGNLPQERLQSGYAFLRCGVDYAGPMYILNRKGRGAKLEKCYLCLFVCFSTRALHLELVTSLTSDGYILALKRFISRRGKPLQIFSDHGRNFVGALKEFTDLLKNQSQSIIDYASDNEIEFKFIPPYAPNFGGLWEAGVKSCKHHITRVIGNAHLTYEEFYTVLVQIEAVLNSRPMYPLSPDPDDCAPLTPAHFLVGRALTAPASEDITDRPLHALTRYKRVEQLRQQFWKRWSTEYISELQKRVKWTESKGKLKENDLVLIKDENLPPLKWRLGRVMKTFPGADGIPRVASIKTASGVIQRACSKICPLPLPESTSEALD